MTAPATQQAYAAQIKLTEKVSGQRDQANNALARAQIALDEKDGLINGLISQLEGEAAASAAAPRAGAKTRGAAKSDAQGGTRGPQAGAPRGPNGKDETGPPPA